MKLWSKQRQAILDVLKTSKDHPTAYDIYERVSKKLPGISPATVFRNLNLLAQKGIIRVLTHGSGRRRYDYRTVNHYHIRCIVCDRVDDVTREPCPEVEKIVHGRTDYEVKGYILEFQGICPACRAKGFGTPAGFVGDTEREAERRNDDSQGNED